MKNMRKHYFLVSLLALALSMPENSFAAMQGASGDDGIVVALGAPKVPMMLAKAPAVNAKMVINGTGQSQTFVVNAQNLPEDIKLVATSGFEVFPETLPAGSGTGQTITVTFNSYKSKTGQIILRSGDYRAFVDVEGVATPLEVKDLSQNPAYRGDDESFEHSKEDGFTAGENGYTVEFKIKTDNLNKSFNVYGITEKGVGFKAYVNSEGIGFYNENNHKKIVNPFTTGTSGGGTIYNTDGKFHTYRFAVTPDRRVFVYRDGLLIDEARSDDFAHSPDWVSEPGELQENLLKNPDFEGEWEKRVSDKLTHRIEGWDVGALDQYNSYQEIENMEIDNERDYTNHVLSLYRYRWEAGWGAAEISQVVDVIPDETYTLTALAKGGFIKSDGSYTTRLGSLRFTEVQNPELKMEIPVTSPTSFETYSGSYTTSNACKQLRITIYYERKEGKEDDSVPLVVDDMTLTGVGRATEQKVGFDNTFADLEYFNYDPTGAYAPAIPRLEVASDSILIRGTGKSVTVKVRLENLRADEPVQIKIPAGFDVYPDEIPASAEEQEITITNLCTLASISGEIVLRSGETRRYIKVTGTGTPLECKDISGNVGQGMGISGTGVPGDADDGYVATRNDGFAPGENGYTVEFRINTDNLNKSFYPFAATADGTGFRGYVNATEVGLYDATYKRNISNPATNVEGGNKIFYNNDGRSHTYRYAVTPDKRMFIYRDGLAVDTVRLEDNCLDGKLSVENGDIVENMLKNSDFESTEYDQTGSDNTLVEMAGWDLIPIDRWNAYARIENQEINNELDKDNHVLVMSREGWSFNRWSALEISQIVDVAPNETYSLSALAKGGFGYRDGGGEEWLGALKVREVQNETLGAEVAVESDSWETYSLDYTTSAVCKQLRVFAYLEKTSWSKFATMYVDNMKLTGVERVKEQQVGFDSQFAGLEYFTYDPTGAYAPLKPGFGDDVTGVEDRNSAVADVYGVLSNNLLSLRNVPGDARVEIYDAAGTLVVSENKYTAGQVFPLRGKGVYICVVDDGVKKQTLKVVY